jgi:DNA-binding NtrC family response regulator
MYENQSIPWKLKEAVQQFERKQIALALKKTNGNKMKAAKMLGIHRNTLMAKTQTCRKKPDSGK